MRASAEEIGTDEAVELSVVVTNTGDRAGDEVVQLYLHDPVARVARPVQAADRLRPRPPRAGCVGRASSSTSMPTAPPTRTPGLDRIVEAGEVQLIVGTSAADERARVPVQLTGATRIVGHDRRLDTPVRVQTRATH